MNHQPRTIDLTPDIREVDNTGKLGYFYSLQQIEAMAYARYMKELDRRGFYKEDYYGKDS